MSLPSTAAAAAQDRRLRRALLTAARIYSETSPTGGWAKGYLLRDMSIDSDTGTAPLTGDNDRAFRLLRDLTRKAYIEERPSPDRPLRVGERFTLGHADFRITARGSDLLNETLTIDPDVEDARQQFHP